MNLHPRTVQMARTSTITDPMFNFYCKVFGKLFGSCKIDRLSNLAKQYLQEDVLRQEIFMLKIETSPVLSIEEFESLVIRRFYLSAFLLSKNSLGFDDETTAKITLITILAYTKNFQSSRAMVNNSIWPFNKVYI